MIEASDRFDGVKCQQGWEVVTKGQEEVKGQIRLHSNDWHSLIFICIFFFRNTVCLYSSQIKSYPKC